MENGTIEPKKGVYSVFDMSTNDEGDDKTIQKAERPSGGHVTQQQKVVAD